MQNGFRTRPGEDRPEQGNTSFRQHPLETVLPSEESRKPDCVPRNNFVDWKLPRNVYGISDPNDARLHEVHG